MEDAGKPSGGRLERSPHPLPPFVRPAPVWFCLFPVSFSGLTLFLGLPFNLADLLGCSWRLILITCRTEGLSGCA